MDQLGIKVGQIQQETYRQPRFLRFYHSDSISLNNFIASITQRTSPLPIMVLLYKHRLIRWFSIESSNNWRFYSNEF
jgi:hypothetical protein